MDGAPVVFGGITGLINPGAVAGNPFCFIVEATVPNVTGAGSYTIDVTAEGRTHPVPVVTNNDFVDITAGGIITVTKTADVTHAPADGSTEVTYTLTYANNSGVDASNVLLYDVLPAQVTYVTNSGIINGTATNSDNYSSGGTTYTYAAGVVTAYIPGTVPAGATGSVTFKVTVNNTVAPGTVVTNTPLFCYNSTDGSAPGNTAASVVPTTCDAAGDDGVPDNGSLGNPGGPAQVDVDGITLIKTQALDTNCDICGGTCSFVQTQLNGSPGHCLRYRIVATNKGAEITNLVIKDFIPTYTTYSCTPAPTLKDGIAGPPIGSISAPSCGSAGTQVIATVADPIATNGQAVLEFEVKIDE
jgi:uncharacterized repeat protein (TIGR01451 family)